MKTTLELPDALLEEARTVAARERTTVRALMEAGLRQALSARKARQRRFKLSKVTFRGEGLQEEAAEGGWEYVRDLIYKGRGA